MTPWQPETVADATETWRERTPDPLILCDWPNCTQPRTHIQLDGARITARRCARHRRDLPGRRDAATAVTTDPAWREPDARRVQQIAARAREQRDYALAVLNDLTDQAILEYARRGRFTTAPDGHKAVTLGDGMPSGTTELTAVESVVDRIVFPGTGSKDDQTFVPRPEEDRTGRSIADLFATLDQLAATLAGRRADITRYSNVGRIPTSAGPCQCCQREVEGTQVDRLKSGYCPKCWMAWLRAGRPERAIFERARRHELAAASDGAA